MPVSKQLVRTQIRADDFFVIAHVNPFVRERRMRPNNVSTGHRVGRLEEINSAQFLVALRRELRDDQIAFFIGEKEAICVLDDEGVRPAVGSTPDAAGGSGCF